MKEQNGALVFVSKWGEYGTDSGQMISPSDIVYNSTSGYLYVVEISNHRVQYFNTSGQDPTGNGTNWWGGWGTGDSQFKYPQGIAVDGSGNVYVADGFNRKVKKFSSSGTSQGSWGSSGSGPGQFGFLEDVAVDGSGNIYAVDATYCRVQKLTPTGQYTFNFATWWGSNGSGQSQFSGPYGVTVGSGRIYVVDTGNSRIQTFDLSTASGWAYNQIGNMTLRDGTAYSYGSAPPNPPQPHAVTTAGTNTYVYDKNGNMTNRAGKTLEWDIENRLKRVKDGQTTIAEYVYDGDGFRVKKTENGVDTLYINRYYEKRLSNPVVEVYYYYLGDKMVGYKEVTAGNPPTTEFKYVHQDHLTGTSMTTYGTTGLTAGTIKYFPYGGTRSASGSLPPQKFTGQRLDEVGLYYYGARYYDPGLTRFVSSDTIVPNLSDTQALNRYSYVINNPLKYTDPTGHFLDWIVDAAFIVIDIIEVIRDPSVENKAALGVDVGLAITPGVPAVAGLVRRAGQEALKVKRAEELAKNVERGRRVEEAGRAVTGLRSEWRKGADGKWLQIDLAGNGVVIYEAKAVEWGAKGYEKVEDLARRLGEIEKQIGKQRKVLKEGEVHGGVLFGSKPKNQAQLDELMEWSKRRRIDVGYLD